MQYPFSCVPATAEAIEATLSPARIGRYLAAADGDRHRALRVYMWNARLCEEFYLPTQLAEVSFRNALNAGLKARYGENWHQTPAFVSSLPKRHQDELSKVFIDETKRHGEAVTSDHMVSGLSFGFWVHLVSSNPRKLVWRGTLGRVFPYLPNGVRDAEVYDKVDQLRRFRNRIAHHNAIFDKGPVAEYRNIQDLVSWICPETAWLLKEVANPARVIGLRPRV